MNTKPEVNPSSPIGQARLLAFVRTMIGSTVGREDDEHPLHPGPWDPVIRSALEKVRRLDHQPALWPSAGLNLGPQPEPWKRALAGILARHPEIVDAIHGGFSPGDDVALNPQPLPPRYAFLSAVVQAVASRAELLQEMADATARKGEQQGTLIVGGYVARFSDDFCGTGFRLRWPFPGPRPHWFAQELDAIDLVVLATRFEDAAKQSFNQDLRRSFSSASARLAEAGLSKLR